MTSKLVFRPIAPDTLSRDIGILPFIEEFKKERHIVLLRSAPTRQIEEVLARIGRENPSTKIDLLCQNGFVHVFEKHPGIHRIRTYPDTPRIFTMDGIGQENARSIRNEGFDAIVIPMHNEDGLNYDHAIDMARMLCDCVITVTASGRVSRSYAWRHVVSMPQSNIIAASARCNIACSFCAAGDRRKQFGIDLDYQTFRQLLPSLDESPGALVAFVLEGEPFMNPNLFKMIRDVKERGHSLSITTNANLIDTTMANTLVSEGLDELRISVNAAEKSLYEKLMPGAKWEKFIEALTALRTAKSEAGVTHPNIAFIMVGMKMNIRQLPGLARMAGEFGVSKIIVNGFMPNARVVRQSLLDDVELLRRCYEDAVAAGAPGGVEISLEEANQYKEALFGGATRNVTGGGRLTRICADPWITAHIRENGDVLPCCGGIRKPLGELVTRDMLSVWNSEAYAELRDQLLKGDLRPECVECKMRVTGPVSELWNLLDYYSVRHAWR